MCSIQLSYGGNALVSLSNREPGGREPPRPPEILLPVLEKGVTRPRVADDAAAPGRGRAAPNRLRRTASRRGQRAAGTGRFFKSTD
ncbi:hypothetical protein [Mycobacterium talmoniae]|uniref:hypothetical protein n=1 Tax=Mycobacterium talmoniae TaxID=1858794 RepID=UPI0009F64590|nr:MULTISPECIES: hypothetical protein [Mycobacterium]TDH56498.1 hypothetical protein E2F47_06270 [Mycobacterium eburneum]